MDEFDLIATLFAPLASPFAFGLLDDAAALPARPGFDLVVTTDQIAEGTDFFAFDPADMVAKKALRVNLSDLAAKGARPKFYLLTLALPASMSMEWLTRFAAGLAADQARFGIALLGGDTGRTEGPLGITVTAMGFVPEGAMIRRRGAKAGDDVYVTGTIGDSGGGLAIFKRERHTLNDAQRDVLVARYRVPEPPVAFGSMLVGQASASVDVSDGLIADLSHLAKASGVKLVLDAQAIPRSDALRALWGDDDAALLRAVVAGDDYQIAFTAPPGRRDALAVAASRANVTVTRIGVAEAGEGVILIRDGSELQPVRTGYRHF